jgi:hypothetical protein
VLAAVTDAPERTAIDRDMILGIGFARVGIA